MSLQRMRAILLLSLLACSAAAKRFHRRDLEHADPLTVDSSSVIVRAHSAVAVPCTFTGVDGVGIKELKWLRGSSEITQDSSASDAGNYTCQATNAEGRIYEKIVAITVLDAIVWASPETRVGGLVGEPLTIDCAASGDPEPLMQITNGGGEALDEELFTTAGSSVTVASLTKAYDGLVVNCVAVQAFEKLPTSDAVNKLVNIEVYYAPEFEASSIDRYSMLDRTATLWCNVSASNPPAKFFNFLRDGKPVKTGEKYEIVQTESQNSAALRIHDVETGDFGPYECEAQNTKTNARQIIMLKQANKPGPLRATLFSHKKHELVFDVASAGEEELPLSKMEILYTRREADEDIGNAGEETETFWATRATKKQLIVPIITDSTHYHIRSLRPDSNYSVRFRAESEAGWSDATWLTAVTSDAATAAAQSAAGGALRITLAALFLLVVAYLQ